MLYTKYEFSIWAKKNLFAFAFPTVESGDPSCNIFLKKMACTYNFQSLLKIESSGTFKQVLLHQRLKNSKVSLIEVRPIHLDKRNSTCIIFKRKLA